jgi:predicted nucleic acid-binding protein
MYLVDTSIWIHALRPSGSRAIQANIKPFIVAGRTAITDWILLELMTGVPKGQEPSALLEWFAPVVRMPFDPEWWSKAWNHAARLRKRGISPSAADCLIATVAMEHHLVLLHCDGAFEAMKPILPLQTLDWTTLLSPR